MEILFITYQTSFVDRARVFCFFFIVFFFVVTSGRLHSQGRWACSEVLGQQAVKICKVELLWPCNSLSARLRLFIVVVVSPVQL